MNPERTLKLIGIFDTLSKVNEETTRIVPNLPVIDSAPGDIGSKYIIVRNELGYLMPAVKTPGIAFQVGDFVNVLYIKGTEPVAFQVGSSTPGGRWDIYLDDILDVNAENPADNYFLKWDQASSYWLPSTVGSGFTLADLSDVSLAGLTDENVLQYDSGNSYWWNAPAPTGLPFDVLTCDLVNPNADYATFTALNTALLAGGTAIIGPGTYDFDNLTLKAADYIGMGVDVTILSSDYAAGSGILVVPDNCVIENMTIDHSYSSGSTRTLIIYNGTGDAVIRNCKILTTNASSGALGVYITSGGTLRLENVEIVANGNTGIAVGLQLFSSSRLDAYSCVIEAISSSTYVTGGLPYRRDVSILDSTSIANLYDTQLVNNTLYRSGGFGLQNIITAWAAEPPQQFNPIINGGMEIWQKGTSFVSPPALSSVYTADQFWYNKDSGTTATHTISQSTDVPTVAQAGKLFSYSLLVDCTTADASVGSTEFVYMAHTIEGFSWAKYAQVGFWISFWVKATKTGIYSLTLRNSGSNRSFVAEYTINTTATWEFKEIFIPASPSAGTWDYGSGVGLRIQWALMIGSGLTTASTWSWESAYNRGSANQVNACDSTANDFRITGVMMSKTRSPFWQPDYQQELARCQRYYFAEASNFYPFGFAAATSTTDARIFIPSPVEMRTTPNVAGIDLLRGNGASVNTTGVTPVGVRSAGILLTCTVASGLVANNMYAPMSSSGGMTFSAEL